MRLYIAEIERNGTNRMERYEPWNSRNSRKLTLKFDKFWMSYIWSWEKRILVHRLKCWSRSFIIAFTHTILFHHTNRNTINIILDNAILFYLFRLRIHKSINHYWNWQIWSIILMLDRFEFFNSYGNIWILHFQ